MKKTVMIMALTAFVASAACAKPAARARMTSHARISASQASKAALAKYHGKVEGKVALENEDGKWQYAVNVHSGKTLREVMVDANTGKIASVEVTTPKEEAKEAAAEKRAGKGANVEKGEGGEKGEKGEAGEKR